MILAEVQAKRASVYPALASVVQTADLWELSTVPQCGGCTSWDSESFSKPKMGSGSLLVGGKVSRTATERAKKPRFSLCEIVFPYFLGSHFYQAHRTLGALLPLRLYPHSCHSISDISSGEGFDRFAHRDLADGRPASRRCGGLAHHIPISARRQVPGVPARLRIAATEG